MFGDGKGSNLKVKSQLKVSDRAKTGHTFLTDDTRRKIHLARRISEVSESDFINRKTSSTNPITWSSCSSMFWLVHPVFLRYPLISLFVCFQNRIAIPWRIVFLLQFNGWNSVDRYHWILRTTQWRGTGVDSSLSRKSLSWPADVAMSRCDASRTAIMRCDPHRGRAWIIRSSSLTLVPFQLFPRAFPSQRRHSMHEETDLLSNGSSGIHRFEIDPSVCLSRKVGCHFHQLHLLHLFSLVSLSRQN